MKCPYCRSESSEVFNSRSTKFGTQIWRRRRCTGCGHSFTTYEAPDLSFLRIKPLRGKALPYSRSKLYLSIYTAFTDVTAPPSTIDAVTSTIEAKLLDQKSSQIDSQQVSEIVLQTLKHFSTAAFVRYLARQTELTSAAQLRRELKKY